MRASIREKLKGIEEKNFNWDAWTAESRLSHNHLIGLCEDLMKYTPDLGVVAKEHTVHIIDLKKGKVAYTWHLSACKHLLGFAIHIFTISEKLILRNCSEWIDGGLDQQYLIGQMEDIFMVRREVAKYLKVFKKKEYSYGYPF